MAYSHPNVTGPGDTVTTVTYLPISSGKAEFWVCPECHQRIEGSERIVLRLVKEHVCPVLRSEWQWNGTGDQLSSACIVKLAENWHYKDLTNGE